MKKAWTIALAIAAALCLSQIRDWITYNLNYQIDHLTRGTAFSYAHSYFQEFTHGWSAGALIATKWIFALTIVVIMLVLTLVVAKALFGGTQYRKTLIITYLIVGTIALILHWLSAFHEAFALASVQLLHALQYPVVLFVLILASPLAARLSTTE